METLITYNINDFLNPVLPPEVEVFALEKDYVIFDLEPGKLAEFDKMPGRHVRFEGLLLTFVSHGALQVSYKNHMFSAPAGSVLALPPNLAARIESDDWSCVGLTLVYLSREFLQQLSFSISAFSGPVELEHRSPVFQVSETDALMLDSYFRLLKLTARQPGSSGLTRHGAASLCVALCYQCMQMFRQQLERTTSAPAAYADGRKARSAHVRDFIRMVHADFARERSVAYYASALCVSPKYLSALVKEITGRTAARWIEDYVIMEAKNLLRYSGKNVQQVAYALNFPNQSAFGKYFKHLTGMSPTEFQKA